ncbi:hypothetical protein [Adlercreutzia murintestinalis]|uniref:hypothetical protein n=1 Tax=Adlercreutzia murintestinalis TaxID=2941325 RepID=UPI00203BD201|nr:hypothetical protein [Adlercreutzia murintestinalis]
MLGRHKHPDPGDPGHIVPYTKGTSNEISFSVLHNMRNAAAEEGTTSRPAWEFPHEEVRQRRRARRRGKRLMVAGMVVAVLGVVALGATAVVINVQNQMDHVARMKGVLQGVVDQSSALQPYNDMLTAALAQPPATMSFADMKAVSEKISPTLPNIADDLRQLKSQLEEVQQHLQVPADREAANQGITVINAQLNLMDMGEAAISWALPAHEAYEQATEAMEHILRANTLAEEATAQIATLNADNARASQTKSEEAQKELTTARDELQAVQTCMQQLEARAADPSEADTATFEAADAAMRTYLEYAQLRLDAQAAAVQSMQAYLDRDRTTLQQSNDRYNQLEQQAADIISNAAATPTLPTEALASVFTTVSTSEADQWSAESARMAQALAAVRAYLS